MRNIRPIFIILLLAIALSVPMVIKAKPPGTVPPGQPFQALQAQIEALQAQIDALKGRGSTIMVHGIAAGHEESTIFIHFGGGVPEYRMPRDGTLQNMRILIEENSYDGPMEVTIFVNGSSTSLSATIPAESISDIDVAGMVDVFDGDRVSVVGYLPNVSSGYIELRVSYEIL